MKVVINDCYGGFSLSPVAIKRLAELNGRECYFFKYDFRTDNYTPVKDTDSERSLLGVNAFDIPNPQDVVRYGKDWSKLTAEERIAFNKKYREHNLDSLPDDRSDPKLVQVVEELGEKANGSCASLKIVEIPDGIEWAVEEYDGMERIEEIHRSWS